MWKVLHDCCPNDLNIQFLESPRHGMTALVPRLIKSSRSRNQTLLDDSFAVMGPRLWNAIPGNLRAVADQTQFKIELTKFLNTIPDKPPVSGYKCANGNSLLDWNKNTAAAAVQGRSDNAMTL